MPGPEGFMTKQSEEEAKSIWQNVDAVCFDVDSTVIMEEGIDCLAEFCDKGTDVAMWTSKATNGSIPYQTALEECMKIIEPSRKLIDDFIKSKPFTLTPGIESLTTYLRGRNVHVYLVSGSFKSLIVPIAEKLKIPIERIHANKLKFYYDGEFAGYDKKLPTARNGGKAIVVEYLKEHGYKNIVFIGDSITDLETVSYADAFIGFGGNVIRDQVRNKSSWYVTDFHVLKAVHQAGCK